MSSHQSLVQTLRGAGDLHGCRSGANLSGTASFILKLPQLSHMIDSNVSSVL